MNCVALSQRVVEIPEYGERRDEIDQKWIELLLECNAVPILIPNNKDAAKLILESIELKGIILSGGNDLVYYGGTAPERDETEFYCIEHSIFNQIPLLGVCRGMQVIQHYFGVKLEKVKGHVTKSQEVTVKGLPKTVNSYHNFGTKNTVNELEVWAYSSDFVVKAVSHKNYPIKGIMWHPERNAPFSADDIELIKNMFNI